MRDLAVTGPTPPGGWWHVEKHSGLRIPERGEFIHDYQQFIDKIIPHRKATGGDLDIGWEERLRDDLCEEHPNYPCMERGIPSERRLTLSDVKVFLHTVSTFMENGAQFVPQEQAEARAAVCARCPLNVPVTGCFGCAGIATAAMDFVANRHTQKDEALQSCNVCGCFLRVKVWIPSEALNDNPNAFPDYCWRKQEQIQP